MESRLVCRWSDNLWFSHARRDVHAVYAHTHTLSRTHSTRTHIHGDSSSPRIMRIQSTFNPITIQYAPSYLPTSSPQPTHDNLKGPQAARQEQGLPKCGQEDRGNANLNVSRCAGPVAQERRPTGDHPPCPVPRAPFLVSKLVWFQTLEDPLTQSHCSTVPLQKGQIRGWGIALRLDARTEGSKISCLVKKISI
jgi:hypothetical protein